MSRNLRVTCHAVDYKPVVRATVLPLQYFESVDDARHSPDMNSVLFFRYDEEELFDEPYWMLVELQPSVSDYVRRNVRSEFDDVKTTCAVGGIGFHRMSMDCLCSHVKKYR